MSWLQRHHLGILLGLAVLVSLSVGGTRRQISRAQEPLPIPSGGRDVKIPADAPLAFRVKGAGSCSAVACHGAVAPQPGSLVLRNEHSTWVSDDDHARAYATLFSERSTRIARNLAGGAKEFPAAHEDPRCLACHTTPRTIADLTASPGLNQDGVGCESCHGPAERWLAEHTSVTWNAKGIADREAVGFFDTKNLARRAEICADCHVGTHKGHADGGPFPPRDVNHDLIAAGHPRLNFELAAYLDNMPRHWVEKNQQPDDPIRVWVTGQLVTTAAVFDLLIARASDSAAPWPEFTEYGCFACHHSLADEAWRRDFSTEKSGPKGPSGSPAFASWYLPMVVDLSGPTPDSGAQDDWKDFRASLDLLNTTMGKSAPDRQRAIEAARACSGELKMRLSNIGKRSWTVADVEAMINHVNDPQAWKTVRSWDAAAGRYLRLVPLSQAWVALRPRGSEAQQQQLRKRLEALLGDLRFPTGYDSPPRFDPARIGSAR
jgi:hypothetical protein